MISFRLLSNRPSLVSGKAGSPKTGRSKIQYRAQKLGSKKSFVGNKFVSNFDLPNRDRIEHLIFLKHLKRGMKIRIDELRVVQDTFFL